MDLYNAWSVEANMHVHVHVLEILYLYGCHDELPCRIKEVAMVTNDAQKCLNALEVLHSQLEREKERKKEGGREKERERQRKRERENFKLQD